MFKYLIVWLHVVTPAGNVADGAIVGMVPAQSCEAMAIQASLKPNTVHTGCATGEDIDRALDAHGCERVGNTSVDALPALIYKCRELPTWN